MNFYLPDIGLKVVLENTIIQSLLSAGRKHLPKEYGGILIGRYDEERTTAYIVKSLEPKAFQNSTHSFVRKTQGLRGHLIDLYNQKPSLFYLGEWHTHPGGVPQPSVTDVQTLIQLAKSHEVKIKNPLMMIIGLTTRSSSIGLFVHYQNKIHKYELED